MSFTYLEDGSVPVYWGDNQYLNKTTNKYAYPSGMPKGMVMAVPKVGRFLCTFGEDDDLSKYFGATTDDCAGTAPGPINPCLDNADHFNDIVGIESCGPLPRGSGYFFGWTQWGFETVPCSGPLYLTSVNGNPCQAIVSITGWTGSPLHPFVFYEGEVRSYKPTPSQVTDFHLPRIIGVLCCGDGGPVVPLPPPPPPPPPLSPGCGTGEG